MTQFSSPKKQRIAMKYATQLGELVRAYQHGSEERVNNLMVGFEADEIKNSDIEMLIGLAQDFTAIFQLLGHAQTQLIEELADIN